MCYSSKVLFIAVLISLLNVSSAFLMSNTRSMNTRVYMSDSLSTEDISSAVVEVSVPAVKKQRVNAKWFPLLGVKAPILLDGTLPGDAGFDPLGFAKSEKTLYWMRDAEVKHARLAMLAAVGWPLSELWHKSLASTFGLESILATGDRAPSILNGGLSNVWASGVLVMSILIAGYLEGKAMNDGEIFWGADKPKDYIPGNYGFDPLNLLKARGNALSMQTAEIKNGRLAMLAITGYVFQEFVTKLPVTEQTPYLF